MLWNKFTVICKFFMDKTEKKLKLILDYYRNHKHERLAILTTFIFVSKYHCLFTYVDILYTTLHHGSVP